MREEPPGNNVRSRIFFKFVCRDSWATKKEFMRDEQETRSKFWPGVLFEPNDQEVIDLWIRTTMFGIGVNELPYSATKISWP
jgi:hypothetical protein